MPNASLSGGSSVGGRVCKNNNNLFLFLGFRIFALCGFAEIGTLPPSISAVTTFIGGGPNCVRAILCESIVFGLDHELNYPDR